MKTCTKCKILKPYEEFRKKSSCKDGHTGRCKHCLRIDELERQNNLDDHEREERRRRQNKAKRKYKRKHYRAYLDKELNREKRKYRENPEKYREKENSELRKKQKAAWTKANRQRLNEKLREKYKNDEEYKRKVSARNRLNYAIKNGRIEKVTICQKCNGTKNIEAHHYDYDKPFDVEWLCRICHKMAHRTYSEK